MFSPRQVFRFAIRVAAFSVIFLLMLVGINFAFKSSNITPGLLDQIFWSLMCAFAAFKIALIKEDF